MQLLDALQNLPLAAMFIVTLAIGLVLCWLIIIVVRVGVRAADLDLDLTTPLPLRDTLIGTLSGLFALMMAFSAAGIWNDTLQASSAVQREANALENVLALAGSLPEDLTKAVKSSVREYGRGVVERDWPAMKRSVDVNDPVYDVADKILIDLIHMLSAEQQRIASSSIIAPLVGQIIEARSARRARVALSSAGVSVVQWLAMLLLALGALTAIAVCHYHHFGMQLVGMHLYVFAATAAFFVILAHDRPFVGAISVSPAPILELVAPGHSS